MSKAPEQPECLSVIVCDEIFRDEQSKKLIIVGTFNVIRALGMPTTHPRLSVLFTLTNGRGTYDLCLRIESAATGVPVAEVRGPLKLDDPLQIADFHIELASLVFPEAGKYWVCVIVDGETIRQRPFVVEQIAVKS